MLYFVLTQRERSTFYAYSCRKINKNVVRYCFLSYKFIYTKHEYQIQYDIKHMPNK